MKLPPGGGNVFSDYALKSYLWTHIECNICVLLCLLIIFLLDLFSTVRPFFIIKEFNICLLSIWIDSLDMPFNIVTATATITTPG